MKKFFLVLTLFTITVTSFGQETKSIEESLEKNNWGAKLKASPFSISGYWKIPVCQLHYQVGTGMQVCNP